MAWGLDLKLAFLTFLAVLGVLYIFQNIVVLFFKKNISTRHGIIVIAVRDAQEYIEGIIDNIFIQSDAFLIEELWIIDCGSSDHTVDILEKLYMRFAGMKVAFFTDITPKEAFKEILDIIVDKPRVYFLDTTVLSSEEVNHLTIFASEEKDVKMGLKYY